MSLNRYYQDELSYLRELGALFAKANPNLAGFLAREADDPDVERLLEAFAFLTARLRQRVDDELPELAVDLLQLIYPQLLTPIPPTTVVAFRQKEGEGGTPIEVPRNTRISAGPVEGVSCLFTTRYPLDVQPVEVERVTLDNRQNSARLSIELTAKDRIDALSVKQRPLRLFFASEREPAIGRALHLWVCRHVTEATLEVDGGPTFALAPDAIRPIGLRAQDDVVPSPGRGFVGYRLLQEYLAIPMKFLFVDVDCFADLQKTEARNFTLSFVANRPLPPEIRVQTHHVIANATPAVNVFETDAYPIWTDRLRARYRVIPTSVDQTIYRVDQATGYVRGSNRRIHYEPFESFRHDRQTAATPNHFYKTTPRPSVVRESVDLYITFVDGATRGIDPVADSVSLKVTASNGAVAHLLGVGAVDRPTGSTPSGLQFRNVVGVTREVPPPLTDRELWLLVSTLARNFHSVLDADRLKGTIATFDFRARYDVTARQQLENLLGAIERFEVRPFDLFIDGRPTRSRQLALGVREERIGGEGELHLLGSVIDAFLSVFVDVNAHHVFRIEGLSSNVGYQWTPRTGEANPS